MMNILTSGLWSCHIFDSSSNDHDVPEHILFGNQTTFPSGTKTSFPCYSIVEEGEGWDDVHFIRGSGMCAKSFL